jgi:hypothetical protein
MTNYFITIVNNISVTGNTCVLTESNTFNTTFYCYYYYLVVDILYIKNKDTIKIMFTIESQKNYFLYFKNSISKIGLTTFISTRIPILIRDKNFNFWVDFSLTSASFFSKTSSVF